MKASEGKTTKENKMNTFAITDTANEIENENGQLVAVDISVIVNLDGEILAATIIDVDEGQVDSAIVAGVAKYVDDHEDYLIDLARREHADHAESLRDEHADWERRDRAMWE